MTHKKLPKKTVDSLCEFPLFNEDFFIHALLLLDRLIKTKDKILKYVEFEEWTDSYNFLIFLENAKAVRLEHEAQGKDYEVDENGEYGPTDVEDILSDIKISSIKKLKEIQRICIYEKKHTYGSKLERMFLNTPIIKWRCADPKCRHFLNDLKTPNEIIKWLEDFKNGKPKKCKHCRANNTFTIKKDKGIIYSSIKTDKVLT